MAKVTKPVRKAINLLQLLGCTISVVAGVVALFVTVMVSFSLSASPILYSSFFSFKNTVNIMNRNNSIGA